MAFCTSCGNEVADSASFCTSCGQRRDIAAPPAPVCSSCGAQVDASFAFCTSCGQPRASIPPAPPAEAAPSAVAAPISSPVAAAPVPAPAPSSAFCTSCGARLEPGISFCTGCGQPVPESSASAPERTVNVASATQVPAATPPADAMPVPATAVAPALMPVEAAPIQTAPEPAPQVAAISYATQTGYEPSQPASGGKFRAVVLVLLLVIVAGACGGWYFWGVETVIVSSPPGVTVFLDDKELAPASYGRYVVPHLSRKTHFLKVQSPGFADTIQRLDFPLTSLHEWVNVKLVPSRQPRPSPSH